jgi:hypothetical protein
LVGVNVVVGVKVEVLVGVGEYGGTHQKQSKRLPLSIEFKILIGADSIFVLYVTQTGLPSIRALNVEPVPNGIGSETKY